MNMLKLVKKEISWKRGHD